MVPYGLGRSNGGENGDFGYFVAGMLFVPIIVFALAR